MKAPIGRWLFGVALLASCPALAQVAATVEGLQLPAWVERGASPSFSPGRELFRAALNVLEGAFRFTTDVAAKTRKREVSIRAAQVTAGIRGTDLWGRSRPGNEIVCLIEGERSLRAQRRLLWR
jgi:hypothetical protein